MSRTQHSAGAVVALEALRALDDPTTSLRDAIDGWDRARRHLITQAHRAGAHPAEIAQAAGISRQRVLQIINATTTAGGTV
jgi:hypothetical protein